MTPTFHLFVLFILYNELLISYKFSLSSKKKNNYMKGRNLHSDITFKKENYFTKLRRQLFCLLTHHNKKQCTLKIRILFCKKLLIYTIIN